MNAELEHQHAQYQAQVIGFRVSKLGGCQGAVSGSIQKVGLVGLEQSLQLGSNASGEPWAVGQRHENLGPHTASRAVGVGNGQGEQTQKEKVHSLRAERGSHNLGKRNRTGTSEAVRMVSA